MRKPERIDDFCKELAKIWKKECPDWRFGQLIVNVFGTMSIDPFFPEEDAMINEFNNFFKRLKNE